MLRDLDELRVLLISSIVPAKTFGGPVLLQRHLIERSGFKLFTIGPAEMRSVKEWSPFEKLISRMGRTRFSPWVRHYEQVWKCRRLSRELRSKVEKFKPQVVLTVAHGPLFWLAKKASKQLRLPLVSIFHDWWPYLVTKHGGASNFTARKIEIRFRELYRQSDCVMPVCEGMKEELGSHRNSETVLPIPPGFRNGQEIVTEENDKNKIVYVGNLTSGYGEMMRRLIDDAGDLYHEIRFAGNSSDWPTEFRQKCVDDGILTDGHVPLSDVEAAMSSALALLVTLPMNQDPPVSRRTSFPSKLASYLKYGRPIVFWGMTDSSIIQWAREYNAKAVFVDESPAALISFLSRLKTDTNLQSQLCEEALRFRSIMDPEKIQDQFRSTIAKLVV